MTTLTVTACGQASILQDGALVEINLEVPGDSIKLRFDQEMLDQHVGRSIQLLAQARNKQHAKAGLPGVPALPAAAAGAGPNASGTHIILVLKTHSGADFHFAIPTHGAEQFAKHIMTAVAEARRQSR